MAKEFDLSTLNLSVGTHIITVKARASGYRGSPASNAVSYVVEGEIYPPTVEFGQSEITIIDDERNEDRVVSYNVYNILEDETETYLGNVLKVEKQTKTKTTNISNKSGNWAARAVDAYGNMSNLSNKKSVCFVAGTPVLMADNTYKNIEKVVVGDEVKSYNFKTKAYCKGTVTKVANGYTTRIAMVLFEDGNYIAMSEGHPLYTKDGWRSLTNHNGYPTLKIGDKVLGKSSYVAIQDIQVVDAEPTTVYSLGVTVSNGNDMFDGTYFAGVGMTLATHGGGSN